MINTIRTSHSIPQLAGIRLQQFFAALRSVIGAVTSAHTADCLLYATVTAAALSYLGVVGAEARMGSAMWRVGAGDGDVIVHAMEVQGAKFAPAMAPQALPFHAWVEVEDNILDFTTWTLKAKARILDSLDGGSTSVEWCPDYLVVPATSSSSLRQVQCGFEAGLYAYIRHQEVEEIVRRRSPDVERIAPLVAGVIHAYRASLHGQTVAVVGVNRDGSLQTEAVAAEYAVVS